MAAQPARFAAILLFPVAQGHHARHFHQAASVRFRRLGTLLLGPVLTCFLHSLQDKHFALL
jgi:hypothetical protein